MSVRSRVLFGGILASAAFLAGSLYDHRMAASDRPATRDRVILYYRDPMHPSYTSPQPGNAPDCGMRLEPVYAGASARPPAAESQIPGRVSISPEKQQWIGVVTGRVERGPLTKTIRAWGRVSVDESRVFPVNAGADGIVRKVFPAFTDTRVEKGQPLASIYGREYLTAQRTLLYALRARNTAPETATLDLQDQPAFAVEEARLNLLDMGFGDAQVEQILRDRKPTLDVMLVAPASGTILARHAFPEQRFSRGAELFRVADLSQVWVVAELFGDEVQYARSGASVRISIPDVPGKVFTGRIAAAEPHFENAAQTMTVRLEAANPSLALRPDMFVDVEFSITVSAVISVPVEALLDSGVQKTVFVEAARGIFEPRAVATGARFGDRVEIVGGLQPGESIVTAGNFLLDSESRLRASR